MIELFRQFERESGIDVYGLGKDRAKWEAALEKFGEMIVQECIVQIQISTARDPRDTPQYKQSVGHQHKIRKHFEIE